MIVVGGGGCVVGDVVVVLALASVQSQSMFVQIHWAGLGGWRNLSEKVRLPNKAILLLKTYRFSFNLLFCSSFTS